MTLGPRGFPSSRGPGRNNTDSKGDRGAQHNMAKAALQVVGYEEPAPVGDPELTREAVTQWKEGQRRCRARRRHNWGPHNVLVLGGDPNRVGTVFDVIEICSHCRNRRSAEYVRTARGLRKMTPWAADYRDGYLLPKGAMPLRLDEDLQDELTEHDILSRKMTSVVEDED